MRCPRCGADNPADTSSCLKCFKALSTDSTMNSGADTSAPVSAQALPSQTATDPSNLPVPGSEAATTDTPTTPADWGTMPQAATAQAAATSSAPYKPSGQFGSSAPVLMLLATLIGAPLVGLLYSYVSQYMNLLFFSQLIAGALLGGLLALAVKMGKCRNPRMAIACGVVGGLLLFSTYLFSNSLRARQQYIEIGSLFISTAKITDRAGKPMQMSPEQAREALSQRVTPLRFFPTYLRMNAESGVTLKGSRSSSSSVGGMTIKGTWYWLLLAAELGLVMLAAAAIAQSTSAARFCERCDEWWKTSTVHKTHPDLGEELVARATAGDWQGMRAVVSDKKTNEKNYCHIVLSRCPKCSDGTVAINAAVNGTAKTLLQSDVPAQDAAALAAGSTAAKT